jgi:hypothetical protein
MANAAPTRGAAFAGLGHGKVPSSNKIVTCCGNSECNPCGVPSVMMGDNNETGTEGSPKPARFLLRGNKCA